MHYALFRKNPPWILLQHIMRYKRFFPFRDVKIVSNVLLTFLYAKNTIYYKVMKALCLASDL